MSKLEEKAFGLSSAEMKQIKYMEVLKRRKPNKKTGGVKKFSENLSMEAQIAMQLALEDTEKLKKLAKEKPVHPGHGNSTGTAASISSSGRGVSSDNSSKHRPSTSISSYTSYSELFERHQSARMTRDITDEKYDEDREARRALGGGKLESAMEIIEVVNKDDPDVPVWDDEAILQLARTNAVDKCLVWMEATLQAPVHEEEEDV